MTWIFLALSLPPLLLLWRGGRPFLALASLLVMPVGPWLAWGWHAFLSEKRGALWRRLGTQRLSPATDTLLSPSWVARKAPLRHQAARRASGSIEPTLGWPALLGLGIGSIIGTGIFVIAGPITQQAGNAALLSIGLAALICIGAGVCYAEMATLLPDAGSAYAYSSATLGELPGWLVGTSMALNLSLLCAAVGVGASGYLKAAIAGAGFAIPQALLDGPWGYSPGIMNLSAALAVLVVTGFLLAGSRIWTQANLVLVALKLIALGGAVFLLLPTFEANNLQPFMPHGVLGEAEDGGRAGILAAMTTMVFALTGFEVVAAAAEDAETPAHLPIGILGAVIVSAVVYLAVITAILGNFPAGVLDPSSSLASVLSSTGQDTAAPWVERAGIIAMPTLMLTALFGLSRLLYAMSRDGRLPKAISRVGENGQPTMAVALGGVVAAGLAAFAPLYEIMDVANAGVLTTFAATALAVLILRHRHPDIARPFRAPQVWIAAGVTLAGCAYVATTLGSRTLFMFLIWNVAAAAAFALLGRGRGRA